MFMVSTDMFTNLESPAFGRHVQALMQRHRVPGFALALVQDGGVTSKAFGSASLDPKREFTTDTIMPVGSIAKALTAAAVGLLVADQALPDVQWTAQMTNLLPDDFIIQGGRHDDVTLEDVLCHRTGMPAHEFSILGAKSKTRDNARSLTRNLRNLQPAAANRSQFIYSNIMYSAASYVVQVKRGLSFEQAMQKYMYQPLRMHSTCQLLSTIKERDQQDRLAVGYSLLDDDMTPVHPTECPDAQGCGQTMSTVDDIGKWIKALVHVEAPFSKDLVAQLTSPRIRQEAEDERSSAPFAALGWDVVDYCGVTVIMHRGTEAGFQSNHFFVPEFEFGGAMFANSDCGDLVISGLTYRLIDEAMRTTPGRDAEFMWSGSSEEDSEDDSDSSSDSDNDEEIRELQLELCPGLEKPEVLALPLSAYTGFYLHDGYHHLKVETKDDALFIKARDRAMAMDIRFMHVAQNTKFIACAHILADQEDFYVKAEFKLVNGKSVRLGIQFETRLEEYIWFDKVQVNRD